MWEVYRIKFNPWEWVVDLKQEHAAAKEDPSVDGQDSEEKEHDHNILDQVLEHIGILVFVDLVSVRVPDVRPSELAAEDLRTYIIFEFLFIILLELGPEGKVGSEADCHKDAFHAVCRCEDYSS